MQEEQPSGEAVFAALASRALDGVAAGVVPGFASELKQLALDNVFGRLWTRPGLDPRARSLVTLGILIALRAEEELKIHAVTGIRNGLSVAELEEVIYHASGYAGFPAATAAMRAVGAALRAEGMIP